MAMFRFSSRPRNLVALIPADENEASLTEDVGWQANAMRAVSLIGLRYSPLDCQYLAIA